MASLSVAHKAPHLDEPALCLNIHGLHHLPRHTGPQLPHQLLLTTTSHLKANSTYKCATHHTKTTQNVRGDTSISAEPPPSPTSAGFPPIRLSVRVLTHTPRASHPAANSCAGQRVPPTSKLLSPKRNAILTKSMRIRINSSLCTAKRT